jgi:hypothetical protein
MWLGGLGRRFPGRDGMTSSPPAGQDVQADLLIDDIAQFDQKESYESYECRLSGWNWPSPSWRPPHRRIGTAAAPWNPMQSGEGALRRTHTEKVWKISLTDNL